MSEPPASAFVPGHVTAFFSPHRRSDPARTGSVGAGITLSDGVSVRVEPAGVAAVEVNGDRASMEPVERVLDALDVEARVVAETPLPIGAGFGVSGATALGTALAANRAVAGARSENDLVTVAHRAEVESGTGLGDVVAQARGGVPIRLEPGAPGHGALDGIPAVARVEYVSFGGVDTADVLAGDTDAIASAGEGALERLREAPTLARLFEEARRFAREAGLCTPRVEGVIEDVLAGGGEAAMGMLGETVVALDTGLSDAGYDPEVCHTHPAGASLRMD